MELLNRLVSLQGSRRQLLAQELIKRSKVLSSTSPQPLAAGTTNRTKDKYVEFYNEVSRRLDASPLGDLALFLNYGYVSNGEPQYARCDVPVHLPNRSSVKLVLEVIGACPVDGRRILDIGCGRGGTIDVLRRFFRPAALVGVDLSSNAIAFCARAHDALFCVADAENLPFPAESFDIVTNIESSHSYPDLDGFLSGVRRIVRPGGCFLYTDLLPHDHWGAVRERLRSLDLFIQHDRDITGNVILSCDAISKLRADIFSDARDRQVVDQFLASPGSDVYRTMDQRTFTYRILHALAAE